MGGGCACQGAGIGIVMHIKRRQRSGAARVQVDIAFLTACRIDFLLDYYARQNARWKRRGKNEYLSITERGNNIDDVLETASNSSIQIDNCLC